MGHFAAFLIGAVSVGAYSKLILTPQFTSEAKLYVLSKETTLASLADLQIGSQLTQDYKVMITSRPVLQDVIAHLELDMDYKELEKKLKIDNPNNTRILALSIEDPDPYMAKAIVDDVASTASDYIGEIMEMIPPKLIEDGEVATEKTSPRNGRNAAIGGLIGLFLVCGAITLRVVLNDTVKTEEDVQKYLDLPVLAVVPVRTADRDKRSKQKRKSGNVKAGGRTISKTGSGNKTGNADKIGSTNKAGTSRKKSGGTETDE
ncbi:Wzz/FepE/Etk N-terminal domain-containing protein [Clostridium sp. AM58-1XD]|uniref:YveK family protein n=1 Tax=Clostridium sp. AM58-1XD TaxID=2292307 RepID=UPI00269EB7D0